MLEREPARAELEALLGAPRTDLWYRLAAIDERYEMDCAWDNGGKRWTYEYKYRRGGKTLCALYAKPGCFGLMMIFGAAERESVEALRGSLGAATLAEYDGAAVYHDGKWAMFCPADDSAFPDYLALLACKRRPNRR